MAFNFIILIINSFAALLLVLQKTSRKELKESIEEITGKKYVEGLGKLKVGMMNEGIVVVRPKKEKKKEGLLTKFLRVLGVIEY